MKTMSWHPAFGMKWISVILTRWIAKRLNFKKRQEVQPIDVISLKIWIEESEIKIFNPLLRFHSLFLNEQLKEAKQKNEIENSTWKGIYFLKIVFFRSKILHKWKNLRSKFSNSKRITVSSMVSLYVSLGWPILKPFKKYPFCLFLFSKATV